MGKIKTTIRIEAELRASLNKICVRTGDQTYHIEQALRGYGPIKKLGSKPKQEVAIAKAKGFVKPEFEELSIYFQEKGSTVCNDDAQAFLDHFNSNGWKVGKAKNPMKCWKSAVGTWLRLKPTFSPNAGKTDDGNSFTEKHTKKDWRTGL